MRTQEAIAGSVLSWSAASERAKERVHAFDHLAGFARALHLPT